MRKVALLMLVALALSSCASVANFPAAECEKRPDGYALVMHGIRDNMTHSIVRFMLQPTYEAKLELLVPKISGQVDGSEVVHVVDPTERFSGAIEFTKGAVVLSLLHGTVNSQIPLDWNGRYQLTRCVK
jgi:hypothetical protein